MAEPKKLLETALFSLLEGDAGITWSVYNTQAIQATFSYVVFQAAGGDDGDYHHKARGRLYEYQVVGVHTNRSTALDMAVAIEAAMATAENGMSLANQGVVDVYRVQPVDYTQVMPDGVYVHHIGGIYAIELEEV